MRPGIIFAVFVCFGAVLRADTTPPVISSIDPAVLVSSASPQLVTLTGSNFMPGATVDAFNFPSIVKGVTVVSSTKITFTAQYQPTAKLSVALSVANPGSVSVGTSFTITPVLSNDTPIVITEGRQLRPNVFAAIVQARVTPGSTAFLCLGGPLPAIPGTFLGRLVRGLQKISDDDGDGIVQFPELPWEAGQIVFFVVDSTGRRTWAIASAPFSPEAPLPEATLPASVELGVDGSVSRLEISRAGVIMIFLWVRPGVGAWSADVTDGVGLDADGLSDGHMDVLAGAFAPIGPSSPATPASFQPSDVLVAINPEGTWWSSILPAPLTGTAGNGRIHANSGSSFTEGQTAIVLLQRRGGSEGAVSVDYQTIDGFAIAGRNYVASSGTVTFARGEFLKTISIPTIDDRVYDNPHGFTLLLTPHGTNVEGGNPVTVFIQEGDPPPALSIFDVSVDEGDTGIRTVNVPITLSGATRTIASAQWRTSEGKGGVINFAPGESSKTVAVSYTANTTPEPDRQVTITLELPNSATISRATAVVTIVDDDTPHVSVNDVSVAERSAAATFTVSLARAAIFPVTVQYATVDGTATAPLDYTRIGGQVTFAPGEVLKNVAVPVVFDDIVENDETFLLRLTLPAGGATITKDTGVATIVDSEPERLPVVLVDDISIVEGSGGVTHAVFNVRLSFASLKTVTVSWRTRNGSASDDSDYEAASGMLVFAPGEIRQQATVNVVGDTVIEPNEAFSLVIESATSAVPGAAGVCTILDDDTPPPRRRSARH